MPKRSDFLTCQRVLVIMMFIGFMLHHTLRVNISIAVVEMINKNYTNSGEENFGPRYNWNEEEKNDILGYFFWGYVLTQIPGGRLSEKFGGKVVIGSGLLTASIMTLLTPVAAQLGLGWLVFVRFCLGIGLGIHWPSALPVAIRWIPQEDMAKFMSHMVASSLGVAITLPSCGYLIAYLGWPSVFYVTGSIALIWSLIWCYAMYDTPEIHPRISREEKERLNSKIESVDTVQKLTTPWRKIFTSGPVWAIIVGNTCISCTFFVVFNQLPTYMDQVLRFNIKTNGWFSSLPYLVRYFVAVVSAIGADKLLQNHKLSRTVIRKSFTISLFFGMACLFTIQAFWGYSSIVSVIIFTSCMGLMGFATPGLYTNPVDIAPPYAGTVYGISQVPAALTGYITTKIVAFVTKDNQNFEQWTYVFWLLVITNLIATIFTAFFLSGEEQSWSKVSDVDEKEKLEIIENNLKK